MVRSNAPLAGPGSCATALYGLLLEAKLEAMLLPKLGAGLLPNKLLAMLPGDNRGQFVKSCDFAPGVLAPLTLGTGERIGEATNYAASTAISSSQYFLFVFGDTGAACANSPIFSPILSPCPQISQLRSQVRLQAVFDCSIQLSFDLLVSGDTACDTLDLLFCKRS